MVAPLVCGVCVERQRSLVPILYKLLISECVVAKCFLIVSLQFQRVHSLVPVSPQRKDQ